MDNSAYLLSPEVRLIRTNKGLWEIRLDKNLHRFISQTQGYILFLCDGTNSLDDIVNKVAKLYCRSIEECLKNVKEFLEEEVRNGTVYYLKKKLSVPLRPYHESKFVFLPQMEEECIISKELNSIGIILTEKCDYNCIYCFGSYGRSFKKPKQLPLKTVLDIIKEAKSLCADHITLSGGDPFAYGAILDVLNFIRAGGFRSCEISTKGIRLTRSFVHNLKKAGLKRIQISLDSLNSDINDYLFGIPKSTEYALRAIFWSKWYGIDVSVRSTVTNKNYSDVGIFIDELYQLGIRQIRMVSVLPTGKAQKDLTLSSEQSQYVLKVVKEARAKYKNLQIEFFSPRGGIPLYCSGGKTSLFVYPDGDVAICDLAAQIKKKFLLGNIYNDSLQACLERSHILNINNIEACSHCYAKEVCCGGCRIISYSYYGKLNMPYPLCNFIEETSNNNEFLDFDQRK